MPGFITAAVPAGDTGSAMGFYQVLRSIGLALGSAMSGVILVVYTRPNSSFPSVGAFRTTLLIAAGLSLLTAIISYVLPGNLAKPGEDLRDSTLLEEMRENAELGGAGLMLDEGLGHK
jgi:MFS family permease